jgi:hypothetical protein
MGMADIALVYHQGDFHGATPDDDRNWKRFKAWAKRLGAGEIFSISYTHERDTPYHRKYMGMMRYAFHHWEPAALEYKGLIVAKDFDKFRKDILILAGFYEAKYNLDGSFSLEAQSLKFKKMPQEVFERVYAATFDVLLKHVLTNYTREDLHEVIARLENFQGRSAHE